MTSWHQHAYVCHNRWCEHVLASECAVWSFAFGHEGGGFQLVYADHLSLAGVGAYFQQEERSGSSLFLTRVTVYVCVCMCVRTPHPRCTCGSVTDSMRAHGSGRDDTWKAKSRWTESRHMFIRIYEQNTHVHINAGRQDKIWSEDCFSYCS